MKLLFLSTHNLATNPRLYKEIKLASSNGFEVQVICFEFDNWSKAINERLKTELGNVRLIILPAGRSPFLKWFPSVLTEHLFRLLGRLNVLSMRTLCQAISRRNSLLLQALDRADRPDWVIGHNPGAMFASIKAGQRFKCRVGFDVEDYHPGEGNDLHLQGLTKKMMAGLLPRMDYVSFASPLIMQEVKKDLGGREGNWFTLLNYFPASEFKEPVRQPDGPLKLVWFSQNIHSNRGLELVLPAIEKGAGEMELHLIGNLNADFYEQHLKQLSNVIVHPPLSQNELHHQLDQYDVGLAIEPAKDRNNELAVSNKILTYLQAGLYVMATNTPAQEWLLQQFPAHGISFDIHTNNSASVLQNILAIMSQIRESKNSRYKKSAGENWETASKRLLGEWKK